MKFLINFGFIIVSLTCLLCCKQNNSEKQQHTDISDEQMMKVNKYLVEKDNELIEAYIKRRNWKMKITKSGLWYMKYKKGNGKASKKGKLAKINYSIELLDGTPCYSSDSLGSKTFQIGKGSVIPGLEEGILLMNEGDKARFIIPPHLAFHLIGDENRIPARAIIVYDVELLKIYEN